MVMRQVSSVSCLARAGSSVGRAAVANAVGSLVQVQPCPLYFSDR